MRQDPSLNDEQLESEIKLVGDLVLAASQSSEHLTDAEVDALLGLAAEVPAATADDAASEH